MKNITLADAKNVADNLGFYPSSEFGCFFDILCSKEDKREKGVFLPSNDLMYCCSVVIFEYFEKDARIVIRSRFTPYIADFSNSGDRSDMRWGWTDVWGNPIPNLVKPTDSESYEKVVGFTYFEDEKKLETEKDEI